MKKSYLLFVSFAALCILGFGFGKETFAATFTVCASGCNATTIQSVFNNNNLEPGDVVEIRDSRTYPEEVYWGTDDGGAAGNPVTLRAAAGQTPTIAPGMIFVHDTNYVKIGDSNYGTIHVTHTGCGTACTDWFDGAIYLARVSNSVIENNSVHDVQHGNGINLMGSNNNIIQHNIVYNIGTDQWGSGTSGDGIVILWDGIGNVIQDNVIHDPGHGSISLLGEAGQVSRVSRTKILNNYIYGGRGEGVSCLHSDYCLIEGNLIYNSATVQTDLSKPAIQMTGANHSTVRRNIIFNQHHFYAIELSIYSSGANIQNNYVYNNTIYNAGGPAVYLGGFGGLVSNNKFYNNIFWDINSIGEPAWWWGNGTHRIVLFGWYYSAASEQDWGCSASALNTSELGGHDIKNNILRSNGGVSYPYILGYECSGGSYVYEGSVANMQSSFPGAISGNLESDPLLAAVPSGTPASTDHWWYLRSGSPAIDAGIPVDDPNATSAGWGQLAYSGSAPDIGAYESDSGGSADTEAPTVPENLVGNASSSSSITLSWTASTDNVGIAGYEIVSCSGSGCSNFAHLATTTGTGVTYSNTGLSANTMYSYRLRAYDGAGNTSAYSGIAGAQTQSDSIDTIPPSLTQATAVPSVTRAPSYSFSSTEAGTITYGGGCTSATTQATAGSNTISFSTLTPATYASCTIRVTDAAGNASSLLSIPSFTVTYKSDLNLDRTVNLFDFNILKSNFGTTNSAGDVNGDGTVNLFDFNTLKGDYGRTI